jgi:cephalosporin-C deacetylase
VDGAAAVPFADLPIEELRRYRPPLTRPDDFDDYWAAATAAADAEDIDVELLPHESPTAGVECFEVWITAVGGGRLAGWYARPAATAAAGTHPGLATYHGYGLQGALPIELAGWAAQGICALSIDCRGQGGRSEDVQSYSSGIVEGYGWLTRGIEEPSSYYFRHAYLDARRALHVLAGFDEVDSSRVAVHGISQGGGLALAVAALSELPVFALSEIPAFLDFPRAITIANRPANNEVVEHLRLHPARRAQVMRTLAYIDNVNLAPWIRCPTHMTVCLRDDVCPPSSIFAAYNHLVSERSIDVFPELGHEVPDEFAERRLRLVVEALHQANVVHEPVR